MKEPYKLLIVDDSKLMRNVIAKIFDPEPGVKVVGEAENGKIALEMIPRLSPDVISLDINMPIMDGLTTLKHIMIKHPTPTVMCSTLTQEGAKITFDALYYGAIDFISKPTRQNPVDLEEQCNTIIKKIKQAAEVKIENVRYVRTRPDGKLADRLDLLGSKSYTFDHVFVVGASEGGYGSLLKIIPQLNADIRSAFIVVLYEPAPQVDAFVRYLDNISDIKVKRVMDGEPLSGGVCYIASENQYVTIDSYYGEYLKVNPAPFPDRRGAVNMLMFSVAEFVKERSVGVILSGSGDDGAEGIREFMRIGGTAIVQDPKSCLYREMPSSALKQAKVDLVLPDHLIASKINSLF